MIIGNKCLFSLNETGEMTDPSIREWFPEVLNTFKKMKKYKCEVCGYIYDPEMGDPDNGVAPGTAFEDLPEDWVCPLCGEGKEVFEAE